MKISKDKWGQVFDALASDYQMLAPKEDKGEVNFKRVNCFSEVKQGYLNTKLPAKALFFPQHETLFSYQKEGQGITVKNALKVEKTIAFGVRPCDARAFLLLDKVFNNDQYRDPYYCDRRDTTLVIGLACSQVAPTCFCSQMGLSPVSTAGTDLLFIDLGEAYAVEAVTEKGKEFVAKLQGLEELNAEDQGKLETLKNLQTSSSVDISALTEKLDSMFDHPYWDSLHEKCLGCNACTFSCPTCHCFDITEEFRKTEGNRVRSWDSCMAPLFTKHGSGHNPREDKKARWRQRMMHKFNYFVHNNGDIACVGCGRCLKACPVNMDLRQVIDAVNKAELVVK